jgi:hypothetical protein
MYRLQVFAPGLIFDGTEGVRARFHVLRYRGRRVPISCFALPDSFCVVSRPSGLVFMFCAPGLFLGGNKGDRSVFHVLRSRNHFGRYRGRRVPFSSFAHPDSFSTVPRASRLVFMFCAPGLILGGTEGAGSRFRVLRSQTRFGRYRGRRVLISSFAFPDSFSTAPRASGLLFSTRRPRYRPKRVRERKT